MSINYGSKSISDVYYGSGIIAAIYYGAQKIWSKVTTIARTTQWIYYDDNKTQSNIPSKANATQYWVVPDGVTKVIYRIYSGQSIWETKTDVSASYIQKTDTITVTPGQVLVIYLTSSDRYTKYTYYGNVDYYYYTYTKYLYMYDSLTATTPKSTIYTMSVDSTKNSYNDNKAVSVSFDYGGAIQYGVNITITQQPHETITVTCGGVAHTESFVADYGTTYTAAVVADSNYIAGTISSSSGTLTDDITITATKASLGVTTSATMGDGSKFTIPSGCYSISIGGDANITGVSVQPGYYLEANGYVNMSAGYKAQKLLLYNASGSEISTLQNYTHMNDTSYSYSSIHYIIYYQVPGIQVTVAQSNHQTITVTSGGTAHTSDFAVISGATYTATIVADTGYVAGTLSSTSGTVTADTTISATAAIQQLPCTVTITQTPGQTITVTYLGTAYTSTFSALTGNSYTAAVVADSGFTAGTLNNTGGVLSGDTTISAGHIGGGYIVTIDQSAHQTITVACGGVAHTSNFAALSGASYTATITGATNYTAGTLSTTSGTVTADMTISATAAISTLYTVTIVATDNQILTATCNGTTYNEGDSWQVDPGTSISMSVVADSGYTAGAIGYRINDGTNTTGTSCTATGNVTISAAAAKAITVTSGSQTFTADGSVTLPANCKQIDITGVVTGNDDSGKTKDTLYSASTGTHTITKKSGFWTMDGYGITIKDASNNTGYFNANYSLKIAWSTAINNATE